MVKNIGVFGRRNVGKSSFVNSFAGQEVSIVSPVAGTTTDPVKKRIEIFGAGICNIIDTAGIDDFGEVGELRAEKSKEVTDKVDMAILLFADNCFGRSEMKLLEYFREKKVPLLLLHNKSDITPLDPSLAQELKGRYSADVLEYSCNLGSQELEKERKCVAAMVVKLLSEAAGYKERPILEGFVEKNDLILLVCPIDSQAPSKRLILPQVMAIRDVLDNGGEAVVLQPAQLPDFIAKAKRDGLKIKLTVTDSQAFAEVNSILPHEIPLTGFSILMARAKGSFDLYLKGLESIGTLNSGDSVLILESCTHHAGCEDIGRVKIPEMLRKYLAEMRGEADFFLHFDFVAGAGRIDPKKNYRLAIQCGGCMVTKRELVNRVDTLAARSIPVTNYGMTLAFLNGMMERIIYEPQK